MNTAALTYTITAPLALLGLYLLLRKPRVKTPTEVPDLAAERKRRGLRAANRWAR